MGCVPAYCSRLFHIRAALSPLKTLPFKTHSSFKFSLPAVWFLGSAQPCGPFPHCLPLFFSFVLGCAQRKSREELRKREESSWFAWFAHQKDIARLRFLCSETPVRSGQPEAS